MFSYVMGSVVRIKCVNFLTYSNAECHPGPSLNMVRDPSCLFTLRLILSSRCRLSVREYKRLLPTSFTDVRTEQARMGLGRVPLQQQSPSVSAIHPKLWDEVTHLRTSFAKMRKKAM